MLQPREFLQLGIELASHGAHAQVRTAISRLYYANHLCAAQRAHQWNIELRGTAEDHGALISALQKRGGRFLRPAEGLRELRNARNHADYHIVVDRECKYCTDFPTLEFSAEFVEELTTRARDLFARLERL